MISVIIPVYNMETYLGRCLDSVLGSGYPDFEVILVDDGSTDRCPAIGKAYARKDSRVKYIRQENQGVSAARNRGLQEAAGEWVVFVDADDYVAPDFLAAVAREEYAGYDLLLFDHFPLKERGWRKRRKNRKEPAVYSGKDIARNFTEKMLRFQPLEPGSRTMLPSPCCKAYKREIIERYGIRFIPKIIFGEDQLFNMEYWQKIASCLYVPETMYYVRMHMASATRRPNPELLESFRQFERSLKALLERDGLFPQMEDTFYTHALSDISYVLVLNAFHPHAGMKFQESLEMCGKIQEDEIYREALKYNKKNSRILIRILIAFFRQKWYHAVKLICWAGYFYQYYVKRA